MNPATKLWNTGYGATIMREAVTLMGGYGVTEDCPGFLPQKWMDAQLEATYEGPEAVQRRHLTLGMTNTVFKAELGYQKNELEELALTWPETGAASLAKLIDLWIWTIGFLQKAKDANGRPLYHGKRQGVTFPFADSICWILASRSLISDVVTLRDEGSSHPVLGENINQYLGFYADLCHIQVTRAAGETSKICAELVYGYASDSADSLQEFAQLRSDLDISMTGTGIARDRAAQSLAHVMIPEALDYPL